MKKSYTVILMLFLLILASASAFAQPDYDLQFRLEDDGSVSGFYEVTAQIKANGSNFEMGSSNLVFTYNTAALISPAPIGPGPDSLQLQAIHNYSGGGNYNKMTLTEPDPGRLSLNIELYDPGMGDLVPMSFVDVATIRFTILDEMETSNLVWRSDSPNPLIVFGDDEATPGDANNVTDEVLLADLRVFLQGPYSGGAMSTALNTNGDLPLKHPFNVAPWNYAGLDSVAAIPANVVDWVLLELRSGPLGADSLTSRAAFINNSGVIVDLNGSSPVTFDVDDNDYHVAVFHRNHLTAMNTNLMALNKASNEAPYDFTTGSGQFYGTDGAIELETGVWGMISGDTDASGTVDANDRALTWNDRNKSGYENGDCDLSGTVDANDRATTWNNRNKSTPVENMVIGNPPSMESDKLNEGLQVKQSKNDKETNNKTTVSHKKGKEQ